MIPPTLVIFGASGDLTQRKLVPALYNLWRDGLLPPGFAVVGFARRPKSDEQLRVELRAGVAAHSRQPLDPATWDAFAAGLRYHQSDFDSSEGYSELRVLLDRLDAERGLAPGAGGRLFYMAAPPQAYTGIVSHLGAAGLARPSGDGWARVIVEKPLGRDLTSARALNAHLLGVFDEGQIYRIDHYLGKETVQNILAFRLGNSIFEPLWNRRYIEQVQIMVAEQVGLEGRGGYYDSAGAVRDMVQNHIMQVLALVAMEAPATFTAEAVRGEKVKLFESIRPLELDAVVRGQYAGYQAEPGVAPGSTTETYAAMRVAIDTWRWAGVPFYLRTGKALSQRLSEVAIKFRQPPLSLFAHADHAGHTGPDGVMEPNILRLRIQPDEAISLQVGLKPPGGAMRLEPVQLGFRYAEGFGRVAPEAYERLLLDALRGDATLFIRRDEAEAAWALITPLLDRWAAGDAPPLTYAKGSWGPDAAQALITTDERGWLVA